MVVLWIAASCFCATICEWTLANAGLCIPVLLPAVFYAGTAFGWKRALVPGLCSAFLLDTGLGRLYLPTFVAVCLALRAAEFWRLHGGRDSIWVQCAPGAVLGTCWAVLAVLLERGRLDGLGSWDFWRYLRFGFTAVSGAALATPVLSAVLDRMGARLRVPILVAVPRVPLRHGGRV